MILSIKWINFFWNIAFLDLHSKVDWISTSIISVFSCSIISIICLLNIDISFDVIDNFIGDRIHDGNIEKISSIISVLNVSRSNILCYLEDNKNKEKFLESALSNANLAKELAISLKTNTIKDKALEMANDTINIVSLLNTTENLLDS